MYELTLNEKKFLIHKLPGDLEAQSTFLLLKQFADRLQSVAPGPKRDLIFADDWKGLWATIEACFDGKSPAELGMTVDDAYNAAWALMEYCILGTNHIREGWSVKKIKG